MNKLITSTILGALALGIAIPAVAEYAPKKVDLACMKTAVTKREDAIIAAKTKAFAAYDAAFKTRRDSLKSAWDKTNAKERREAINAAWKTFRESHKAARTTLRNEDKAAWTTFKTDRKTCKIDGGSINSDGAGEKTDAATL